MIIGRQATLSHCPQLPLGPLRSYQRSLRLTLKSPIKKGAMKKSTTVKRTKHTRGAIQQISLEFFEVRSSIAGNTDYGIFMLFLQVVLLTTSDPL